MANKSAILITVLVAVIVIMGGVLVYSFLVKPKISGYTVEKQSEGVQLAVNYILTQLYQNGFVQISDGNQTIILVPYTPSGEAQTPSQAPAQ